MVSTEGPLNSQGAWVGPINLRRKGDDNDENNNKVGRYSSGTPQRTSGRPLPLGEPEREVFSVYSCVKLGSSWNVGVFLLF